MLVCFFHLPFYAQIRKYIGIVRPEYNSETFSFLKAFQNELKAKGYNAYANYIDPYGKAEAGFTTQGENTYIPLKLQGGVEVIFNHEDKFKYGFGLSYANLKFKEFGCFDEVDNFVDKDISVVTIYGKFCL